MYLCLCVCVSAHAFACVCACVRSCIRECVRAYVCVSECTCGYVCIHGYMSVHGRRHILVVKVNHIRYMLYGSRHEGVATTITWFVRDFFDGLLEFSEHGFGYRHHHRRRRSVGDPHGQEPGG